MADWWYVIVIVVVAVLAVLFLRDRQARSRDAADRQIGTDPTRDFRSEREDTRLTGMSAEDREWETASLRRNQENRERTDKAAADESTADQPAAEAEVKDREQGP